MPRIREYFARDVKINVGPLQSLASAQAEAGRSQANAIKTQWDSAGKAISDTFSIVEKHLEQNDTSKLTADGAMTHAQLKKQWSETVAQADPNDPEVADKFMNDVVQPTLDKMSEGINTQRGQEMYEQMAARIKADMFETSAVDQSTLRGNAAVNNLQTFRNKTSSSLQTDPTGFRTAVAMTDVVLQNYQATYGNEKTRDQLMTLGHEMKHEFAVSALQAMAKANPAAAKKAIASGAYDEFIDGTDKNSLDSYADQQQGADDAEQKSAAVELRKTQKDAFNASAATLSGALIGEDGRVVVPPNYFKDLITLSQAPEADAGTISALRNAAIAALDRQAKGPVVVSDPHVVDEFKNRMGLDPTDPRALTIDEVFQAAADGRLSEKDLGFYTKWVNSDSRDPEKNAAMREFNKVANAFKTSITKSNMLRSDAAGDLLFSDFTREAQSKLLAGLEAGKPLNELLDRFKPGNVFEGVDRYILSKTQARDQFRQQTKGTLRPADVKAAPEATPARAAGETPAAYLKRIGGK